MPKLTQRAVVLAVAGDTPAIGSTLPTPTAANSILVMEPTPTVEPTVVERNFSKPFLGRTPHLVGKKVGGLTFQTEAASNGRSHNGDTNDRPPLDPLLRACGFNVIPRTNA